MTKKVNFPGLAFNVTEKQVKKLLSDASKSRDRNLRDKAKDLIQQINAGKQFAIAAGGHSGGFGGNGRVADPNPHMTIEVNRRRYHLQYKFLKNNQMILVKITG
ncbi:MAG: hypothetical protein WBF90_34985 [Rivularia sp. (in: cyanobacteria)]